MKGAEQLGVPIEGVGKYLFGWELNAGGEIGHRLTLIKPLG